MWQKSNWPYYLLVLSVFLVLIGGVISLGIQSSDGVTLKKVNFSGTDGKTISGTLYIPPEVTTENKAPGVVAVHGYINSRDTMEPISLELARRGYVVFNADQMGHGLSDPPSYANGYGGPDSLKFLRSRSFVQDNRIGLVGHSMGGWSLTMAAATYPTQYNSIVLLGSSTGSGFTAPGSPTFPSNLNVVFSKYGEFSQLMWGKALATEINESGQLENVFGTDAPVEEGRIYGSIQEGTARQLDIIPTIHPVLTQKNQAIEETVDWIQKTVPGGEDTSAENQIWVWHEIGSMMAYIGVILFIFPLGALMLRHPFFSGMKEKVPDPMGLSGKGKLLGAIISGAIGILTFFPVTEWGSSSTMALWPQQETNGIMAWAVVNGIIVIGLFLLWHFFSNREKGATMNNYGITWKDNNIRWRRIGKALLFGFAVVTLTYFLARICNWAFKVSPHYWVFTMKQFTVDDFVTFLSYLGPFTFYFLAFGILFHGEFRSSGSSESSLKLEMVKNFFIITIPFAVLLLAEYIPRLMGGTLLTASYPLWTIIAFQFIPILGVAALVSTFFFRKTGSIYPGAFLNGTLVTWLIVASQATHVV